MTRALSSIDCYHLGILCAAASDKIVSANSVRYVRSWIEESGTPASVHHEQPAVQEPIKTQSRKTDRASATANRGMWSADMVQELHHMFEEGAKDREIAQALGVTEKQVWNRISYEKKLGKLSNRGKTPRGKQQKPWSNDYRLNVDDSSQPMPGEVVTYEEDGQTITKYPPGYARGIIPSKNIGVSHE